jgi:hypothetical protein
LLVLSCCGCWVFGYFRAQHDRAEFGGIELACSGLPAGGGAGPWPTASPLALGFERDSDGWDRTTLAMPHDIAASTRAEASLVLCFDPERTIEDPVCTFSDAMWRTHDFRRRHATRRVRIVAAATGVTLHDGEVATAIPECLLTSTGLIPSDGHVYDGGSVGRDDILTWYQAWLATAH